VSEAEADTVFPIPIPPPAPETLPREPGSVRPSRTAVIVMQVILWLGVLVIVVSVLFIAFMLIVAHEWASSRKEADRRELAHARQIAAEAEQPLRAAALDGTLTDTEIAAVLLDPWTVSRSAREIRVTKRLYVGPSCTVYTVSLPIGPQAQLRRSEVPSCNMDGAAFHLRPIETPTP
jgi:hypothetical protein